MSLRVILLLMLCVGVMMSQAEAVSMGKVTVGGPKAESNRGYAIGVILSDACIAAIKSNHTTNCPSYRELQSIDNSIPAYSGAFRYIDGFYQREQPKMPNSMGYYQYDPTFRVFVDPPHTARMQIITIESQLKEYHLSNQLKVTELKDGNLTDSKATKSVRTYSTKRFVDPTCTVATITADNWQALLPDTINFMRNDCNPNQTQIKTIQNDIKVLKTHDIGTSAKWKLDKFYQDTIKNCTKSFQACKKVDNRAVTTKSDRR